MLIFDRIVLVILTLGIWTLVLSPREIGALALQEDEVFDGHFCTISGDAYVELPLVRVDPVADFRAKVDTSSLSVDCTHG